MTVVQTSEPVEEDPAGLLELVDLEPETLLDELERRGWGDGLPVVPPTPERVDAMLAACGGDPDEVLGVLPPRRGAVTRRTVAINAVLAGCPPRVMPVVLAAARILGGPRFNLEAVNPTTHPVAPLVIVHGEAVERLGFNAGSGAFGPGNRANATVGRAVRLLLLHTAGARPGEGDRSTQGQPSKYTYCVAENLPASPWGSYAASRGVDAPSAITVAPVENPHNVADHEDDSPEKVLDKVASNIASLGSNHSCILGNEVFVALGPEHAASIAGRKWSRADVAGYLQQRARIPAAQLIAAFDQRSWPRWMRGLEGDDLVPLIAEPDHLRLFVVGGPGKHSSVLPCFGTAPCSVTERLDL